jgi:hypothetical protein
LWLSGQEIDIRIEKNSGNYFIILGIVRINGKGQLYKMKMLSLWCQALDIYVAWSMMFKILNGM